VPLTTEGTSAAHACAFARQLEQASVVVLVPRLVARLTDTGARLPLGVETWADTAVRIPAAVGGVFADVFTGATVRAVPDGADGRLLAGEVLTGFPVALLERKG
jgi:(1->4)-alpha-D-glucan 1-alpha-D-glucosylmutase